MTSGASAGEIEHVVARMQEAGVDARVSVGREATVIAASGDRELLATLPVEGYPGVDHAVPILKPYKLVAREISADPTVIEVEGRKVGDTWFGLIAGPCSVETREQTLETARAVARGGRDDAPRRGVQAAHVAVHVPGSRRRRARDPAGGARRRRGFRSSPS